MSLEGQKAKDIFKGLLAKTLEDKADLAKLDT